MAQGAAGTTATGASPRGSSAVSKAGVAQRTEREHLADAVVLLRRLTDD